VSVQFNLVQFSYAYAP